MGESSVSQERSPQRRRASTESAGSGPLSSTASVSDGPTDFETVRRHARKSLGRFIADRTRRRPIVIPVVMEA